MNNIKYTNEKESKVLNNFFKYSFPNDNITDFGKDCFYTVATDMNTQKIVGISRTVYDFQNNYQTQKNKVLNNLMEYLIGDLNLEEEIKFYFLTGIYVESKLRGRGIAIELLKKRLSVLELGSYIYTDILKTSPLIDKYYKIGLDKLYEDEKATYLFGRLSSNMN